MHPSRRHLPHSNAASCTGKLPHEILLLRASCAIAACLKEGLPTVLPCHPSALIALMWNRPRARQSFSILSNSYSFLTKAYGLDIEPVSNLA